MGGDGNEFHLAFFLECVEKCEASAPPNLALFDTALSYRSGARGVVNFRSVDRYIPRYIRDTLALSPHLGHRTFRHTPLL